MSEIRYYEERPCEHGRQNGHEILLRPHGTCGGTCPLHVACPGGSRREITVDYEAAVEASIEAQVAMPPLANRFRIVALIVDAALGRGDTGEEGTEDDAITRWVSEGGQ